MSTWRQKAIEIAPELRSIFQQPDLSLYLVFSNLLSLLEEAHIKNDVDRIIKIYEYAEWCHTQKEKELWNAAGVSFYEHLGDSEIILKQIPKWLKRNIYHEIRDLLMLNLRADDLKFLDKQYDFK